MSYRRVGHQSERKPKKKRGWKKHSDHYARWSAQQETLHLRLQGFETDIKPINRHRQGVPKFRVVFRKK